MVIETCHRLHFEVRELEGGREGRREGGKDGGREGRTEGGREGRTEGGREGWREGGKDGGREGRTEGGETGGQAWRESKYDEATRERRADRSKVRGIME